MNKTLYLPTALGISLLSGCSDSNIDLVKNTEIHNSNYTYGQIYDNRKMCDSIQWSTEQQSNGETIVISTCTFKLSQDQLQKSRNFAIAKVNEYYDIFSRSYIRTTEEIQEKIEKTEQTPNIRDFDSWMANSSSIEEARAWLKGAIERKEKSDQYSYGNMETIEYEIKQRTIKLEEAIEYAERDFKSTNNRLNELKENLNHLTHTAKSEVYSDLDRLKSADLAQLDEILGGNLTVTQSVYFQVLNNRVELKTMDLVFSGRKAPLNYDDITYLATEQIAPNSANFLNRWEAWAAVKAGALITYSIKNPQYSCNVDGNGVGKCKKTR